MRASSSDKRIKGGDTKTHKSRNHVVGVVPYDFSRDHSNDPACIDERYKGNA